MRSGDSNDSFMSEINVTPLVDVMLVLLIIFMVTAPMMVQGLDVALPQVTAKALETKEEQLMITVNKDQQVFINDFQVTVDTLQDKLAKILQGRVNPEVYLKADRDVPYGVVAQVMAQIKDAGVDKLGMVTEPAAPDKDGKKAKPKRG
ncbi:MAG: protein TolR [Desulfobacterales bacterium]|jgi:biopolymer transport protein TolR|nr:protein TolR [Desulfobacterales bacterium]